MLQVKDLAIAAVKYGGYAGSHMATFGENLKRLRLRAKLTQTELAERMDFSNNSPVSSWERASTRFPEPALIEQFAKALGVPPAELLEEVETPYDRLRSPRDLSRHGDRGSSSAAHSQPQQGGHDVTGAATARLLAELSDTYDTFYRAVSDVARNLSRIVEDAPARIALGATRKGSAGRPGRDRKVG